MACSIRATVVAALLQLDRKVPNEQNSKNFVRSLKMSCRIDRVIGGNGIAALCISGQITKQDMETLRKAIEDEESPVALDLKNVDLVDREAVKFLARRELDGIVLRNCSLYIREWVTREQTEMIEITGEIDGA